MKKQLLALTSIALIGGILAPTYHQVQAQIITNPNLNIRTTPLECNNPGTHQDVAKTPIITNNTNKAIPAGTTIYWKAYNGVTEIDKGQIKLDKILDVNKSVQGLGSAGQVYTCKAYY